MVGLTVAAVALAACSSSGGSTSTSAKGGGSGSGSVLKITVVPPSSGALASFGADAIKGWQVAVDTVNASGGVLGHKVQLVKEDTDGTTAATVRSVKNGVSQGGAKYVAAVMTSPENVAVNQQLTSLGALSFNSLGQDDGLIGASCTADAFHTVQTDGMNIAALSGGLAKLPGTKFAIMASDYSTGHGAATVFAKAAKAAGKTVVTQQFAPLNTTDFGSYITKLKASGADAIFMYEPGADGVAFINQATQFKLFNQIKTVTGVNTVSEPLFPVLGDKIVGEYSAVQYNVDGTNALNQAFVAAYKKAYKTAPYYVPADSYVAAETLFAGIKKANSIDPAKVRAAEDGLTFDSIEGSVTMRGADHQLLRPTYVGQVVKTSTGSLAFKIISTIPASVTTPKPNSACKL
jgi:branched-chain amino acid transport system substrate-binding protein